MALTDAVVRNSKPQAKPYTLKDIQGLSLYISPTGNKAWHYRYTLEGKRNRVSLGQYPDICLKEARQKCEDARFLVKNGFPPHLSHAIEASKEGEAVEVKVKIETFEQFSARWKLFKFRKLGLDIQHKRQSTHIQIERYMRIDLLPGLGRIPLNEITKADILKVLRKIENRGALSIAEKCRCWLNEIFRHAIAEGIIETNPAADMDILALPQNPTLHNPYLTIDDLPEFLAKLENYQGSLQTKLGIKLLFLTGVRTGELRLAKPEHFDLKNNLWRIPAEHVKQLQKRARNSSKELPPYIIPLSTQAVSIIKQLLTLKYPWQPYLLCHRSNPREIISENTLNYGIRRLGYKDRLTGHGIRATLSTALNEMGYHKEWIEAQLSHSDKDQIRATYNHAQYVEQRRTMMQEWADKLDLWQTEGLQNA